MTSKPSSNINDIISYHKLTYFPSSCNGFQFNKYNSNQWYFASGNKLVLYDFNEHKKLFRINLKGKKITSFTQSTEDKDIIYVLDIENSFYVYRLSDKQVIDTYQLDKNNLYYSFIQTNNSFYFLSFSNTNAQTPLSQSNHKNYTSGIQKITVTVISTSITEEGLKLKKQAEYTIKPYTTQSNSQPWNKNNPQQNNEITIQPKHIHFSNIEIRDNVLVFSIENVVYVHNLLNKSINFIPLQKRVTCLSFINSKEPDTHSWCVGDFSGKMHFISNITDQNYIISTKHWHSHKVNSLLFDKNCDYLYSGGYEGVIVIWNLLTDVKSFFPRINGNIVKFQLSDDSKFLSCYWSDNTIKVISWGNMKIIEEIAAISPHSFVKKEIMFSSANSGKKTKNKEMYLIFCDKVSGVISFYNIGQNCFPFTLNIMNKNFSSRTENEKQNLKLWKDVSISTSAAANEALEPASYMLTNEEINDNNFVVSYLKFWKITKNNIEMLTLAENAHWTEGITGVIGSTKWNDNLFISVSRSCFKVWKASTLDSETNKFICVYTGKYRHQPLLSVCFGEEDKKIYALYNNFLVQYDYEKAKNIKIYSNQTFIGNKTTIKYLNSNFLILYNERDFVVFNINKWNIAWAESFGNTSMKIYKVLKSSETMNILIQKDENIIYSFKYELSEKKRLDDNVEVIEKKKIDFVDIYKQNLIVWNTKKDIFLSGKQWGRTNMRNGKTVKEIMDENDIEIPMEK